MHKKKICVVVFSRANYARIKTLLLAINNHEGLELELVVGASALLYRFGNPIDVITNDGRINGIAKERNRKDDASRW